MGADREVQTPAYRDDTCVVASLVKIAKAWPYLKTHLALGGHELYLTKSFVWILAADDITVHEWSPCIQALLGEVQRAYGGFRVMGGGVQECFETFLGPFQQHLECTRDAENYVPG